MHLNLSKPSPIREVTSGELQKRTRALPLPPILLVPMKKIIFSVSFFHMLGWIAAHSVHSFAILVLIGLGSPLPPQKVHWLCSHHSYKSVSS